MNIKKYFLLSFLFFLSISYAFSQKEMLSKIEVHFEKAYRDEVIMYPFATIVQQTIYLNCQKKDSLQLNLESPMIFPFNNFFFPEMHITAFGEGKKEDLNYEFIGTKLSFQFPSFADRIVLNYKYQGDLFFKCGFETIQYLLPHVYSWNSWYFTNENLCIEEARIKISDDMCLFINVPYKKIENTVRLLPNKTNSNDISFIMLLKKYYDIRSFICKNAKIDLYQAKGTVYSDKDTLFYPGTPEEKYLKDHEMILKKAVSEIANFFKISSPLKISIADRRLTKREKVSWGITFSAFQDESFILIDSLMWNTNSLYHELIHAYDQDLFNKCIVDSAYFYFFRESIIEYLSIYLKYSNPKDRDEVFDSGMLVYAENKTDLNSIIDLKDNYMKEEEGGTAYIVYKKTPFVIHCFSKKIGEKRFISIFKDFYRQAKEKNKVSFKDFEDVAKQHGVTEKEWNWFVRYL